MYWHGMIEGTFCQDQGRAHFRVRRALPTWRGRSRALPCCLWIADFTQGEEVGEVETTKGVESRGERGVESNENSSVKSRGTDSSSRLHPLRSMRWYHWVKSGVLYETERAA